MAIIVMLVVHLLFAMCGCMAMVRDNPLGLGASWKEEVLLHDGTTLIVTRSQSYGGYPVIESRSRSLREEEWEFIIPGTKQEVIWKNDAHRPPEGTSLTLILLDFLNGVPHIATYPAGCISYNHWGRPNPPYVFFKYNGTEWQRIPLEEFPTEFNVPNVIIGRPDHTHRSGIQSVATVKEENSHLEPHLHVLAREPIKVPKTTECEKLIYYKGAWVDPGDSIGRRMMDRISK